MNEVILGDCLEKIKDIPDNSIDLIITSPPYDNIENAGYAMKGKDILPALTHLITLKRQKYAKRYTHGYCFAGRTASFCSL